jgi:hypothetical protein
MVKHEGAKNAKENGGAGQKQQSKMLFDFFALFAPSRLTTNNE